MNLIYAGENVSMMKKKVICLLCLMAFILMGMVACSFNQDNSSGTATKSGMKEKKEDTVISGAWTSEEGWEINLDAQGLYYSIKSSHNVVGHGSYREINEMMAVGYHETWYEVTLKKNELHLLPINEDNTPELSDCVFTADDGDMDYMIYDMNELSGQWMSDNDMIIKINPVTNKFRYAYYDEDNHSLKQEKEVEIKNDFDGMGYYVLIDDMKGQIIATKGRRLSFYFDQDVGKNRDILSLVAGEFKRISYDYYKEIEDILRKNDNTEE